ncbi:substrate-binding periplasmic protein [Bdellovibrio sp. HCB337]|uniref:substrate-binding periplasmic protein n=1 Tax=Bdellovibrio sp. HCB337 TaxID=3394358 RepID=UPI0039A557E4
MRHILLFLLLSVTAAASTLSAAENEKNILRFSASSTWPMPYGQIKDGVLVDGFMLDIANAISKEMGLEPQIIVLPRNRTEQGALSGAYDIRCHLTKKWVPDPDLFIWSEPLFVFSTIVIGHKGTPRVKKLSDLNGKTLGTVLGYSYPALNEAIDQGKIIRDDTENQTAAYQKVGVGNNLYAVTDELSFEYYLKTSGKRLQFAKWQLELSSDVSHCAILKKSKVDPMQINKAIQRLKRDGTIDKILARYR